MKSLLLAAVAGLGLTAGTACAADLYSPAPPVAPAPRPPPVVAPPPVPTWTGFYIGINAGLGANRFELRVAITLPLIASPVPLGNESVPKLT